MLHNPFVGNLLTFLSHSYPLQDIKLVFCLTTVLLHYIEILQVKELSNPRVICKVVHCKSNYCVTCDGEKERDKKTSMHESVINISQTCGSKLAFCYRLG